MSHWEIRASAQPLYRVATATPFWGRGREAILAAVLPPIWGLRRGFRRRRARSLQNLNRSTDCAGDGAPVRSVTARQVGSAPRRGATRQGNGHGRRDDARAAKTRRVGWRADLLQRR